MDKDRKQYWKTNLRLIAILVALWVGLSYLFGVVLVEPLNSITIAGTRLGFWFSQQGSIVFFLILALVYAIKMNRIDRQRK